MKNNIHIFTFAIFCSLGQFSYAQNSIGQQISTKTITTSVPFLLIPPDAATVGMAYMGVAIQGSNCGYIQNPAKMGIERDGIRFSANYMPWLTALKLEGINYRSFALSGKWKKHGISLQNRTFRLGKNVPQYDIDGILIGHINPVETSFDALYSYTFNKHFSLGANLSYFRSDLMGSLSSAYDIRPAKSIMGGLGAYYQNEHNSDLIKINYSVGLAISNIGPKISYNNNITKNFIPTNLGVGAALRLRIAKYLMINPAIEFNKLLVPSLTKGTESALSGILKSGFDANGGFAEELQEITVAGGLEFGGFIPLNETERNYVKVLLCGGYLGEAAEKGNRKLITLGLKGELAYSSLLLGFHTGYISSTVPNHPLQGTVAATGTIGYLLK